MVTTSSLQRVTTLYWDADDGVPEFFEALPETDLLGAVPSGVRRAGVEARVGRDGWIDVLALRPNRGRLLRLTEPRSVIELPDSVVDAVPGPEGSAIVLRRGSPGPVVESVSEAGVVSWQCAELLAEFASIRLLQDRRATYVTGDGTLATVDARGAQITLRWRPGGDPVISADGRVVFVRWNESNRRREVVLLDPVSGVESVVPGTDESFGFLARLIGVDQAGRCYGFSAGELGRLTPDGRVDWRIRLANATVTYDNAEVEMRSVAGGFGAPGGPSEFDRLIPPAAGSVTPDGRVVLAVVTAQRVDILTLGSLSDN